MDIATKEALVDLVYPVGSLYWSSKATNPGQLFGGTWTQIKDKFIYAQGSSAVNTTGGAATVTITDANMPAHTHGLSTGSITVSTNPTFSGTEVATGSGGSWKIYSRGCSGKGIEDTVVFAGTNTVDDGNSISSGTKRVTYNSGEGMCRVIRHAGHTHSVTAKGTISGGKYTLSGNTGSTGKDTKSITALDKMPPYIVKYCWERTA